MIVSEVGLSHWVCKMPVSVSRWFMVCWISRYLRPKDATVPDPSAPHSGNPFINYSFQRFGGGGSENVRFLARVQRPEECYMVDVIFAN